MVTSVHRESEQGPAADQPPAGVRETTPLNRLLDVLAEEAISVDETDANEHKARLRQMGTKPSPDLETRLQLELRTYRESAEKKVITLRRDLANTADAMQEYVTRFASHDENQEKLLNSDLERLALLRRMTNLSQVQAGLDVVRQSIASTVQQIKAHNQAIVAQLRDEIRTLHKRLESSAPREIQTGTLVNRAPFERRIRAKVNGQEVFSLYLVRITNWKEIFTSLDQEDVQTLVTNVANKLASVLGPDTFSGRWYDGYFAAIVGVDKRKAMEGASDLAQQIAGVYAGGRVAVAIRIRVAVVDYILGHDADQTLKRVEQLIRAFEG